MAEVNQICPNCGSDDFVTSNYMYDRGIFQDGVFQVTETESDGMADYVITCRECSREVDTEATGENGIVLVHSEDLQEENK